MNKKKKDFYLRLKNSLLLKHKTFHDIQKYLYL